MQGASHPPTAREQSNRRSTPTSKLLLLARRTSPRSRGQRRPSRSWTIPGTAADRDARLATCWVAQSRRRRATTMPAATAPRHRWRAVARCAVTSTILELFWFGCDRPGHARFMVVFSVVFSVVAWLCSLRRTRPKLFAALTSVQRKSPASCEVCSAFLGKDTRDAFQRTEMN